MISMDYGYLGISVNEEIALYDRAKSRVDKGENAVDDVVPGHYLPVLIIHDDHSECVFAVACDQKGVSPRDANNVQAGHWRTPNQGQMGGFRER